VIDARDAARRLAANLIGRCAAHVEHDPRALALDDALAAARPGFAAQVSPAHHAMWEHVLWMLGGEPLPGAWTVVLAEIADLADAVALLSLHADAPAGETLCADGAPIDALVAPGIPYGAVTAVLAVHLARIGAATLDDDALDAARERAESDDPRGHAAAIASLIARCREAGVELAYKPTSSR
jgi:hypothetical protein